MLGAMLAGVKCVSHERGINERMSWFPRLFARRLSAILCISGPVRDNLARQGIAAEQLVVVHNGLDPDRIHAMCEDHRAGAHCDIDDDRTERATGRRIACPGLAVFASEGLSVDLCDATALWKPWFHRPISATIQAGHFVAEETPHGLLAETLPFLLGETS